MLQMTFPLSTSLGHALKLKCPNCGEAKLFKSYLKQVDVCNHCHTKWSEIRADDGPAWLTIMVVGHIVAPLAVWAALATELLVWQLVSIGIAVSIATTLATLPFAKAIFIAIIWHQSCGT